MNMRTFIVFAWAFALCVAAFPHEAVETHPFGINDIITARRVGEPMPNGSGRYAVFTVREYDPEANKATTNLYNVDFHHHSPLVHKLTQTEQGVSDSPVGWYDEETILFTSTRSGSSQVWAVNVEEGDAYQVTDYPVDIEGAIITPDQSRLVAIVSIFPGMNLEQTAAKNAENAKSKTSGMVFDHLMVRHWDTWENGQFKHLFAAPFSFENGKLTVSHKTSYDLMPDLQADCPSKPFGGIEEFTISPDSSTLAYTSKLGLDYAWTTNFDVFVTAMPESSDSVQAANAITSSNIAWDSQPNYSPDGRFLAYIAMAKPQNEADRFRVKLFDTKTGVTVSVTEHWDRSVAAFFWNPTRTTVNSDLEAELATSGLSANEKEIARAVSGYELIVTAEEHARKKIFAVDVAAGIMSKTKAVRVIVGDSYNHGVKLLGSGAEARLVFSRESMTRPAEIYTVNLDGSNLKQVSTINDAHFAEVQVSAPQDFWFQSPNGVDMVHGWVLAPVNADATKKHPTVMLIHGGPQGTWADNFSYRWNPQFYAGLGYSVIVVDPHGSTGYGEDFCDAVSGDWGGLPYQDLMTGLDYALEAFPFLDGDRMCALGASYGGFMINWINGHTDRFQCLVNHDGLFDTIQMYYTTEELWFPETEFKGVPFDEGFYGYAKFNPRNHISKWKTPTLVIQGSLDYRVEEGHSLGTFTALQRQNVKSRLLVFPDENHWVLKPQNSIKWHAEVQRWIAEFI